jgi:hypothetical protein
MTNNVILPGDGEPVATDDVSGAHYQRFKLSDGLEDSTAHMRVRAEHPLASDAGAVVRQAPADIWSVGFAEGGSSLLSADFTQRWLGTGVGVSQNNANLIVTTGTSTNAEFLARSTRAFRGAFLARHKTILSQRIIHNNFAVMLADLVGEGLACTINSSTQITVTKTAHGLTTANAGSAMMVGAINGAAGVPGRYTIQSIPDANTIRFNVTGWPSSGSCTVDLFGWNYYWTYYAAGSASAANVDAQRRGYNSSNTLATINTTASPGHVMQTFADGRNANWSDAVVAPSTAPNFTTRASRIEHLPDDDVELYVYLWSWNGITAPASSTTWTIGFVSVEDVCNLPVYLAGVRPQGSNAPLPVVQTGTLNIGTVATINSASLANGTVLSNDVGHQYRANATGAASGAHIVSAATTNATIVKASAGRVLGWSLSNSSAAWRFVKLHNQTAAPTAGTGVVRTIAIPPGGVSNLTLEGGIAFATGIGLTIVTGSADADATAVGVGDVVGDLFFA